MTAQSAYFLVGPTATGKTAAAVEIAARNGWEIVSADSMAVYRGLNIGTATPTAAERASATFHCIDIVDPSAPFSTGEFCNHATDAIADIASRCSSAIVAGGTGLYVKALTQGMDDLPDVAEETRAEVKQLAAEDGNAGLAKALNDLAPAMYSSLENKDNARRLTRALELALSGHTTPPASWTKDAAKPVIAGLCMERNAQVERINSRARSMFSSGLLEEVETLLTHGFDSQSTAGQAIGYAEAAAHLQGHLTLAEAIEKTSIRTRRYAKRQMTWFKHQANVEWIDTGLSFDVESIADQVIEIWEKNGPTQIRF